MKLLLHSLVAEGTGTAAPTPWGSFGLLGVDHTASPLALTLLPMVTAPRCPTACLPRALTDTMHNGSGSLALLGATLY